MTLLDHTGFVNSPKTRPQRAKPVIQAIKLQDILFKIAHSGEITPAALAQVARAWCELEDTKRDIQMKPRPKPVDVAQMEAAKAKRKAPAKGFSETAEIKPANGKPI
jgi:hypothetical protein